MPAQWLQLSPPEIQKEVQVFHLPFYSELLANPIWVGPTLDMTSLFRLYSDGSGGAFSSCCLRRRCAWAIAIIGIKHAENHDDTVTQSWKLCGGWSSGLEGSIQTVPRAELAAFLSAIRATSGEAWIGVDSAYVVDGFTSGRHMLTDPGDNHDLWVQVLEAQRTRDGILRPYKIKGVHKDDEGDMRKLLNKEIQAQDFVGNLAADHLAGLKAEECQLPHEELVAFKGVQVTAAAVQRRIAAAVLRT